jgi:uncharacterized protein involved in outer membrane biogenesis
LVQTTLLSIGIAFILALLAALTGPLFIDWGEYRAVIESEASQMVGAPVRVGGAIDVRLLPTPSLKLSDVQIGPAASAEKVTTRGLAMEFGLGALLQGEFRASQVTLDRPEMRVGLDRSGVARIPGISALTLTDSRSRGSQSAKASFASRMRRAAPSLSSKDWR